MHMRHWLLFLLCACIVALFTVAVIAAAPTAGQNAAPFPIGDFALTSAAICAAVSFTISRRR